MRTPSGCQPNGYLEAVTARRELVASAANEFEFIRVTAAQSDIGRNRAVFTPGGDAERLVMSGHRVARRGSAGVG
jgi:hypothetical protein